jgi:hypothetical protein
MGAFSDKVYERVGEAWKVDPLSFDVPITITPADRAESKETEEEAVERWLIKQAQYACVDYGWVGCRFDGKDVLRVKKAAPARFR